MIGSGANYNWITVGVIERPVEFSLSPLKEEAVAIIKNNAYQPTTNMARLVFLRDGKEYMKTTFTDLW